jgi:Flp pilus assembly protein TadG
MRSFARELDARLEFLLSSEEGQSIFELAVMAPLLLLLMAGAVVLGGFIYDGIEVGNAARAGVQYGAQNLLTAGDSAGIASAAKTDASQVANLTVSPSTYCACDSSKTTAVACPTTNVSPCASTDHLDYFVQVIASSTFTPLIRFPKLPSSITISRTAIQQYTQ